MFTIRMGIPEMNEFWDDLLKKKKNNTLNSDEKDLFKRFGKAIQF